MTESGTPTAGVHELLKEVQVQNPAPMGLLRKVPKGDYGFSGGYRTEKKGSICKV